MTAKILEMPKSQQQLWNDANKLRIGEYADHFTRWMDEYQQKQQVSVKADQKTVLLTKPGNNQALSSQALQSEALKLATENIQTYPGDPGPEPLVEAIVKEDV